MYISFPDISIEIKVDKALDNIKRLLFQLPTDSTKKRCHLVISIKRDNKRCIQLKTNKNLLKITGPNLNNLKNPYNLIGILQAVFRFIGLYSIKHNFVLLHSSAISFYNKALIFGDDGKSQAKTLSSIIASFHSKQKYLGDEFCFLDVKNCKVFSFPIIPIHIRPRVQKYLYNNFKIKIINTDAYDINAGPFVYPRRLFKVKKSEGRPVFIFVHFKRGAVSLNRLKKEAAIISISNCISAHLLKLLHPEYDRMKFSDMSDSSTRTAIKKQHLEALDRDYDIKKIASIVAEKIPCFNVYIPGPGSLVKVLSELKGFNS